MRPAWDARTRSAIAFPMCAPRVWAYALAAHKLLALLRGARRLGRSGVALKDESEAASIVAPARRARIEAGAHGDDR